MWKVTLYESIDVTTNKQQKPSNNEGSKSERSALVEKQLITEKYNFSLISSFDSWSSCHVGFKLNRLEDLD